MTATDELRRLLDEYGVEWSATVGANGTIWTHWDAFNGQRIHAMDNEDGTVEIFDQWDLTPKQAIAATLGAGTYHISVQDNLAETEGMGDVWLECDECCWQMPLEPSTPRFNYCPNCGRRIVEVDA